MPVFLQILGGFISLSGLLMVGFGLPIRYTSLDNTLIAAGITAVVGGMILVGLGAALRELRKLGRAIERAGLTSRTDAPAMPARSPRVSGPLPIPPAPSPIPAPVRAEPRLEPAPLEQEEMPEPSLEPVAADAARQRPSIFALVRGARTEHYEIDETESVPLSPTVPSRAPSAAPERVAASAEPMFDPRFPEPRLEPRSDRAEARTSSPSSLASRTAARIDMPRPVPDLPRGNERSGRNLFDTVWPNEQKTEPERPVFTAPSARAPSERFAPERPGSDRLPDRPLFVPEPEPAQSRDAGDIAHAAVKEAFEALSLGEPEETHPARQEPKLDIRPDPKPVTILKSGVIDGMAYTLYTDGSIEAQLPTGLMRFASIDDLRTYLERSTGG